MQTYTQIKKLRVLIVVVKIKKLRVFLVIVIDIVIDIAMVGGWWRLL